jgi:DNA-binding NarL/FixJ family response regulator
MSDAKDDRGAARRAGASAYVMQDAGSDLLVQTIRDVAAGAHPILHNPAQISEFSKPERTAPAELRGAGTDYLITAQERIILKLLADGLSVDEIGNRTNMPAEMVRTYLAEIYRKLDLPGREAAIHYAHEHLTQL